MSLPSVPSEKALDKLLGCLANEERHNTSLNAVQLANTIFSKSGEVTENEVKRIFGRIILPRKYALIDQRFERILNLGTLQRPVEVLHFLAKMANAASEPFESFTSTISVTDADRSVRERQNATNEQRSRLSNKSIFSDIGLSSGMTPSGDSRNGTGQETFVRNPPRFESTPRGIGKKTPVEGALVGAHSGKILTDAQLIRDILFVMQNIPGHYVKWSASEEMFELDPRHRVDARDASCIESLSLLGFYLRQINTFLDDKHKNEKYGMIGQALLISIEAEVGDYIATLGTTRELPGLTLIMLKHIFDVWQLKLRYLALLLHNIGDKRGGEILSVLYYFIQHGNPVLKLMFQNILDASARPFFVQLDLWIYEGILHDPFNEFLIAVDLQVPVEQFWAKRYRLNREFIPSFVTQNQAEKILLIGKSINFLREVCAQSDCEIKAANDVTLEAGCDLDKEVTNRLSVTYESTSKRLLSVMNENYNLPAHFKAMRSYLLLGQGDFVRHLLDILQEELTKPAQSLYRRNLAEQLETAIRCTNAQFDNPEVLKSLDVRLHDINPGDVGWDVFSLNYSVSGPLLTIFPTEVMRKYIRVFNFLLRAKRMEYNLNHLWGQMMSTSKRYKESLPEAYEVFYSSNILAHEMGFFINQVQYYINFEILECSWAVLVEKIEKAKDLDELINAHLDFLTQLANGCLLADHLWDNLKALRSIFDQIVRFESFQKKIFAESEAENAARDDFRRHVARGKSTDEDQAREDVRRHHYNEVLLKYKYKIGSVRHTYQEMIRDFLSGLNKSDDPNLRCLSWRLDFNGFYKNTQI